MSGTDTTLAEIQQKNFVRARHLRNLLIAHIESKPVALNDYLVLRDYFMRHPVLNKHLPEVVRQNSDLAQVWQFLKYQCSHNERRTYLVDAFTPLLDQLREGAQDDKAAAPAGQTFVLSAEGITRRWHKEERDSATLAQRLEAMDKLIEQVISAVLQRIGADEQVQAGLLPARIEYVQQDLAAREQPYGGDLQLDEALLQCRKQLLAFRKYKLMLGTKPEPAKKSLADYAISQAATGLLQLNAIIELFTD